MATRPLGLARHVQDAAAVLRQFIEGLHLGGVSLVGLGFGGWIAAEMAAMSASGVDALDQLESWETDREMASRLAWKPYRYNYTLPGLLRGVATPALIAWDDRSTANARPVSPSCAHPGPR